jgi:hypothetical protein
MPRRLLWIATSVLCLVAPTLLPAQSPSSEEVRTALTRGSQWLQADMQKWRDERKCGACHHATLALYTLSSAAVVPDAVAPGFLSELTHWAVTDDTARLLPTAPAADTKAKLSLPAVYMSLGLNALKDTHPELTAARQKIVQHLQATQNETGSWTGPAGRPPVMAPDADLTLMLLVAWEPRRGEFPELAPMLDKASAWIEAQPLADSHQELALRILHGSRAATPPRTLPDLVEKLESLQQPNGGWRQTADEPADAFATGQSLIALRRAGVRADDPVVQRGVQFLIQSQQPDGSWPMTSRPHPENKSRAGNLNPITYAGSAWGLSGLLAAMQP